MSIQPVQDEVTEMYGEKSARWYQIAARNQVAAAFKAKPNCRVLIVQPTGTGKTVSSGLCFTSPDIRQSLGVKPGELMHVVFIAHTNRLQTQAEREYANDVGTIVKTHSAFSELPQELCDWAHMFVIEEAHHEAMMSIQYQLEKLNNVPILGLTATPDRPDGCVIKFEVIVEPISREEAVDQGFIAPAHIRSFVDLSGQDKTEIACDILRKFGHDLGQTMMFFATRAEVIAVAEYARYLGINAVPIISQSAREVDELLDSFSNGEVQMLVNCNKINEGVDTRGCTHVFLSRSYGSYVQLNQVIGRAARPDSECHVWELINPLSATTLDTTVIVGTPESHELYSLERGDWTRREFNYTSSFDAHMVGAS